MLPEPPKPSVFNPSSKAPYVWAVVILTMIGAMIVMGVLYLRPQSDALDVIVQVTKGLAPTIAGVLAFMKSQETHLSVNSRLDAFMAEHGRASHAEGMIQGAVDEQTRAAQELAKITAARVATEQERASHAEGILQGTADEQTRAAILIAASAAKATGPIPVAIVSVPTAPGPSVIPPPEPSEEKEK